MMATDLNYFFPTTKNYLHQGFQNIKGKMVMENVIQK